MNEKMDKIEKLSSEVLHLAHNTILVNLRFMDIALAELKPISSLYCNRMATDGEYLAYNPMWLLKKYVNEKYEINRDYLHLLLHCLYRHNFSEKQLNMLAWDLACDITVENIINELDIDSFGTSRDQKQIEILSDLKSKVKILTAEKLYRYFLSSRWSRKKLAEIRAYFFADDHSVWYQEDSLSIHLQAPMHLDGRASDSSPAPTITSDNNQKSNSVLLMDHPSPQSQRWREISERIQQDLETFSKQRGDCAESFTQNLGAVNRERYDYSSFLKRFAVLGEAMKINDDEFDYVFYTYGLKLYEKMPLIEPLEYKEIKAIKEFVIAIDTSGSTSGELVQKFVQKTYNILKSTESFFIKINLHIVQCDAKIQEDKKITCDAEFDEYLKTMKIHGLGGTDFRPVFEYVDQMRKQKEFVNLKGLIYFTDGYGPFPGKKPDYNTAFVFVDDEYNNPHVPPWAIKLVLESNNI